MKKTLKHHSEKEQRRARRRARRLNFFFIVFVISGLICTYVFLLNPSYLYDTAMTSYNEKDWKTAYTQLEKLHGFRDSGEMRDYAECMVLFGDEKLAEAADAYAGLSDVQKADIASEIGPFVEKAESAFNSGDCKNALIWYNLEPENADSAEAAEVVRICIEAEELIGKASYAEARELLNAIDSNRGYEYPKDLLKTCFELEYNEYLNITELNIAAAKMQSISDYSPAASFIRDLDGIYNSGISAIKEGKYADAKAYFDMVAGYKDTAVLSVFCTSLSAAENGDTETALSVFSSISVPEEYMSILPDSSALRAILEPEEETEA